MWYEPGYHKPRRCSTSKVRSCKLWLVLVHVTDLQIWGIGTKEVNKLQYDFLLARYLKCPKMVDGPLHHFAKCHFGGHL